MKNGVLVLVALLALTACKKDSDNSSTGGTPGPAPSRLKAITFWDDRDSVFAKHEFDYNALGQISRHTVRLPAYYHTLLVTDYTYQNDRVVMSHLYNTHSSGGTEEITYYTWQGARLRNMTKFQGPVGTSYLIRDENIWFTWDVNGRRAQVVEVDLSSHTDSLQLAERYTADYNAQGGVTRANHTESAIIISDPVSSYGYDPQGLLMSRVSERFGNSYMAYAIPELKALALALQKANWPVGMLPDVAPTWILPGATTASPYPNLTPAFFRIDDISAVGGRTVHALYNSQAGSMRMSFEY